MKKLIVLSVAALVFVLASCTPVEVSCGPGTIEVDGRCEVDTLVCDDDYHKEDGVCVPDEVTCSTGYHEEDGACVLNDEPITCDPGYHEEDGACVLNEIIPVAEWFEDWSILTEPVGDLGLADLVFTDTGFSVNVPVNSRVGIHQNGLTLEPGYYYEVRFDYTSNAAGKGIFVQLQGHGGNVFTNPGVMTIDGTSTFSQILPMPPTATLTNDGWVTIEITPSGVAGEVTIEDIRIIKTALPNCGENEVLSWIECIPANNGYLPNGTPTAWFTGWDILTVPPGNKEISDLDFTETGYTTYLAEGERAGIELMNYEFESGYTYELSFDYTASVAGRMVWVQMEALGGYGFTNTDTWTVDGTATFTQSLTIPDTYTPTELGWIKLELTPGALDNVTIENITITKTPN